jgi:MoaA/NifB/PqqE/SkfB family radical SAM enzyme
MTFWGQHRGITYPDGYTQAEREIIGISLGKRDNQEFQLAPRQMSKGRPCRAGQSYAVIQADGNVVRCGGSFLNESIGNFFEEDFKLLEKPIPCKADYCKCNEWASLQNIADDVVSCEPSINDKCKESQEIFIKNKEKNIQETRERKIILESKPLRLGIIPTDWCNLRCIMCPTSRHKNSFTFSASVLSKIEELLPYLEAINWQGGEFLQLKYVKEMFVSLKKYPHIENEIITNGLLLDKEWIELLLESNVVVTFSIDSPVKEIYEYIRRGAKYDELIKRLKLIMELERKRGRKLRRNLTVVVMRSNYSHLTEFIEFVKEYEFNNIFFNPVMHLGVEENIFIDPDFDFKYLDDTMHVIKNKLKEWHNNLHFVWNLPSASKKANPQQGTLLTRDNAELFCALPWKSIWIGAEREGLVTPDCWCHMPVGNVIQSTLLEIWNGEMMQKYRRMISANDSGICNEACISSYTSIMNLKSF